METRSITWASASASGIIPRTDISRVTEAARASIRPSTAAKATSGSRNSIRTSGRGRRGPLAACPIVPRRAEPSAARARHRELGDEVTEGRQKAPGCSVVSAELRHRGREHTREEELRAQLPPAAPVPSPRGRVSVSPMRESSPRNAGSRARWWSPPHGSTRGVPCRRKALTTSRSEKKKRRSANPDRDPSTATTPS